jgi:Uncharacterized protein conserved in bacteria
MTRKKKTRRVGSEGPAQYVDKNQNEQDRIARMLKKQKKRKGKKAGSRHSEEDNKQVRRSGGKKDPRIGSKKADPIGYGCRKTEATQTHARARACKA